MTQRCAYHPDKISRAVCAECAAPVCGECRDTVAGKTVCTHCVAKITARVSAEMTAAQQPRYDLAGNPVAAPPAQPPQFGTSYAPTPTPVSHPVMVYETGNPARLLVGIIAGIVVGAIGAVIWDKFVFYTNVQFGLIASLIGWAVGVAVATGSRQGGIVPAVIGGIIAFCAMFLGWFLLDGDLARKVGLDSSIVNIEFVLNHLDVMDWLFIAIGVYGGFEVPFKAGRTRNA